MRSWRTSFAFVQLLTSTTKEFGWWQGRSPGPSATATWANTPAASMSFLREFCSWWWARNARLGLPELPVPGWRPQRSRLLRCALPFTASAFQGAKGSCRSGRDREPMISPSTAFELQLLSLQ
jgi:hypothetical protein